eukprot:jgi/Galph1/2051/GphlegSOOS_G724.1
MSEKVPPVLPLELVDKMASGPGYGYWEDVTEYEWTAEGLAKIKIGRGSEE